ncbi:MAG TPA: PIN domain-containing protein [Nitrolancea sp.]|nr:PIN domain-containing protein [Nitrolancea sp.]
MPESRPRAPQDNPSLARAMRYIGLVVGIIGGWELGSYLQPSAASTDVQGYPLLFAAAVGALLFLVTPYLTLGFFRWLHREIRRLSAVDLLAIAVALLVGGIVSSLLAWPISLLPGPYGSILPTAAAIAICGLTILAMVTKKREFQSLVGLVRSPNQGSISAKPSDNAISPPSPAPRLGILLDTSVVIDGRIVELALTGILMADLVVPQFVLRELQMVADSSDPSRRDRGRRGLEVLERMRQTQNVSLEISHLDAPEENDVDAKLVRIARLHDYWILTGDSNLERVAELQEVRVLNIHQLAHVLRPPLVPGELMSLKIVQAGRELGQGVGFLTDGTMVVVDAGKNLIGHDVKVVVTRTLQTGAGRMAFAQLVEAEPF